MVKPQERKNETIAQIARSLCNHPAIDGKLDFGLNGTQLREQFVGLLVDRYHANLLEIAAGKEADLRIYVAYHQLSKEYYYLFPSSKK